MPPAPPALSTASTAAPAALDGRFQLLVDGVVDYAIFLLDPKGHVVSWNTGAERLKGYRREEIIGRHFSIFYPPEAKATRWPQEELRHAREQGRFEDEGWRVRKDGTLFWANVVITALHGADGTLTGFLKITRDMTQRRRLEELERSSRRMNEFLAMLAHELRNPLAPMRNAVTVMQLEPIASAALRDCRDIIDRQLTHVTRLVDDLLDVGRLATGKIQLRRELHRVDEIVARSAETVRPTMHARGHAFEVEQPPAPMHVNADATRLSQVLQNLLLNAAKFTPDGGRISLKVAAEGSFVAISVSDNGRGIDAANLENIFGLFVQGDNGTPNESGLGIGLTLARSLTEMHGGRLDATSPGPGQGSTFTVRLPLVQMSSQNEDGAQAELAPSSGRRVLVVDDNRDAADSTITILRLLGHQAECAYTGNEALETTRRFRPDVVLLDLAMPDMDGFETLKLLRAQPGLEKVFAIAMTGYGSGDDRRRTLSAGFNAHLTKPVELNALIALLNEVQPAA